MTEPAQQTRRYDSEVRRQQASNTRAAILAAFAEQLGRSGASDVNVVEAAESAGVAVRTVYHHFPDRKARLEGLAAWLSEKMGPVRAPLETADDLPDYVRAAYARAERFEALSRAGVVAGMSSDVRLMRLAATRRRIRELLDALGAPAAETERAAAVIAVLESSEAGYPLVEIHKLSFADAGEAAACAVAAVIADLRLKSIGRRLRGSGPPRRR